MFFFFVFDFVFTNINQKEYFLTLCRVRCRSAPENVKPKTRGALRCLSRSLKEKKHHCVCFVLQSNSPNIYNQTHIDGCLFYLKKFNSVAS